MLSKLSTPQQQKYDAYCALVASGKIKLANDLSYFKLEKKTSAKKPSSAWNVRVEALESIVGCFPSYLMVSPVEIKSGEPYTFDVFVGDPGRFSQRKTHQNLTFSPCLFSDLYTDITVPQARSDDPGRILFSYRHGPSLDLGCEANPLPSNELLRFLSHRGYVSGYTHRYIYVPDWICNLFKSWTVLLSRSPAYHVLYDDSQDPPPEWDEAGMWSALTEPPSLLVAAMWKVSYLIAQDFCTGMPDELAEEFHRDPLKTLLTWGYAKDPVTFGVPSWFKQEVLDVVSIPLSNVAPMVKFSDWLQPPADLKIRSHVSKRFVGHEYSSYEIFSSRTATYNFRSMVQPLPVALGRQPDWGVNHCLEPLLRASSYGLSLSQQADWMSPRRHCDQCGENTTLLSYCCTFLMLLPRKWYCGTYLRGENIGAIFRDPSRTECMNVADYNDFLEGVSLPGVQLKGIVLVDLDIFFVKNSDVVLPIKPRTWDSIIDYWFHDNSKINAVVCTVTRFSNETSRFCLEKLFKLFPIICSISPMSLPQTGVMIMLSKREQSSKILGSVEACSCLKPLLPHPSDPSYHWCVQTLDGNFDNAWNVIWNCHGWYTILRRRMINRYSVGAGWQFEHLYESLGYKKMLSQWHSWGVNIHRVWSGDYARHHCLPEGLPISFPEAELVGSRILDIRRNIRITENEYLVVRQNLEFMETKADLVRNFSAPIDLLQIK